MILKILYNREGKEENVVYDEWNFFDNIVSASNYFDDVSETSVVSCVFNDGHRATFSISNVAYLMSDTGKTIEKIMPAREVDANELGDSKTPAFKTMQEAAASIKKER